MQNNDNEYIAGNANAGVNVKHSNVTGMVLIQSWPNDSEMSTTALLPLRTFLERINVTKEDCEKAFDGNK